MRRTITTTATAIKMNESHSSEFQENQLQA
jgi:hypothetical protein